jgi:dienelactone hydrolase
MADLPPWGEEIVRHGWSALAIDAWCFGERSGIMSESETFKLMLWRGQVLWGMMIFDSLRALDYLTKREEVDSERIATLGMSMGSTMAWWTAALDERIRMCVDICCLTDFDALVENGGLDRHGLYYYVPGLLNEFTSADINALIAPRPHLSLTGVHDPLTPVQGLDRIEEKLNKVYLDYNAQDAWRLERYNAGHEETPAMRQSALAFLTHHFK